MLLECTSIIKKKKKTTRKYLELVAHFINVTPMLVYSNSIYVCCVIVSYLDGSFFSLDNTA
jgi:hypothetical protein